MFCKSVKSNQYWMTLLVVGTISLVFGVVGYKCGLVLSDNGDMLLGMFSGLGSALIVIGVIRLLHNKFSSAQKLKEEEINLKDERNIQILRAAFTFANGASTILFAVMAFVFIWLGYRIPAFIAVGALWIQVIAFFISYAHYNKIM